MSDPIEKVERAIDEIRRGRMVILVDDEDRENEGDLVLAAEKVTPESINFMATYGRGLICLALTEETIERLKLPMMVRDNQAALGTAFTVSIEARTGVTTGISARDRARTIQVAVADDAEADELVSPGHIFPLRARPGGVLVRTGQTEGSVDLARLAGLKPAGVICEIMREDGEMARMPELEQFAAEHDLMVVSVADLVAYRLRRERILQRADRGKVRPGLLGPGDAFDAIRYRTAVEETEYLALVRGDVEAASKEGRPILVRVQSVCPIGDVLGVRPEIPAALRAIDEEGLGVVVLVYNQTRFSLSRSFERQVLKKLPAAATGAEPPTSSEALRDFGLGAQVLAELGCRKIRLLSNSRRRIVGIEGFGIEIVERVEMKDRPAGLMAVSGGKNAGSRKDRDKS